MFLVDLRNNYLREFTKLWVDRLEQTPPNEKYGSDTIFLYMYKEASKTMINKTWRWNRFFQKKSEENIMKHSKPKNYVFTVKKKPRKSSVVKDGKQ